MSLFGYGTDNTSFTLADRERLIRIEQKLDFLLERLGNSAPPPAAPQQNTLSPEVQALARDPANKIQAIALYRQQTGASLAAAKAAVENFMQFGR